MAARAGTDHTGRPGRRHQRWRSGPDPSPASVSVSDAIWEIAGRSETAGIGSMTVVMAAMVTAEPARPVHVACGPRWRLLKAMYRSTEHWEEVATSHSARW